MQLWRKESKKAKNLSDFMNDLKQDEALREALGQATGKDSGLADVVAFAAQRGYDFTEQDVEDLKKRSEGLSKEELRKVAGGVGGQDVDSVLCMIFFGIDVVIAGIFG